MPSYQITRNKFLAESEAIQLITICRDLSQENLKKGRRTWPTRYMLVHLALKSGLRVSEMAALKIGDLWLTGQESFLVVQRGKGGKRRDVYLDQDLAAHLTLYLVLKTQVWHEPTDSQSPLFAGRGGGHYTTTALQLSFKRALAAAGLSPTYSIHSARHTYATHLLAKTNNLRFVQKQLGHASMTMTAHYADVLPELNQTLANAILN